MATIEREPIRAAITIGNISISTPDVVSFNVKKSRGQMAATFSASVKMDAALMSNNSTTLVTNGVVIEAGLRGREKTIFTGSVHKCTINPIRTDASKVMVSLSGKDVMAVMEGQKINRRIKTYRDGTTPPERWGVITALVEDNTPVNAAFGKKTFSKKLSGVQNIGDLEVIYTGDAYAIREKTSRSIKEIRAEKAESKGRIAAEKKSSGAGGSF